MYIPWGGKIRRLDFWISGSLDGAWISGSLNVWMSGCLGAAEPGRRPLNKGEIVRSFAASIPSVVKPGPFVSLADALPLLVSRQAKATDSTYKGLTEPRCSGLRTLLLLVNLHIHFTRLSSAFLMAL